MLSAMWLARDADDCLLLRSGGGHVRGHAVVAAAASPVLAQLIRGPWRDSGAGDLLGSRDVSGFELPLAALPLVALFEAHVRAACRYAAGRWCSAGRAPRAGLPLHAGGAGALERDAARPPVVHQRAALKQVEAVLRTLGSCSTAADDAAAWIVGHLSTVTQSEASWRISDISVLPKRRAGRSPCPAGRKATRGGCSWCGRPRSAGRGTTWA